jgi:hypothetical protein
MQRDKTRRTQETLIGKYEGRRQHRITTWRWENNIKADLM